jgi:formyltetrahydrofolate synthetase
MSQSREDKLAELNRLKISTLALIERQNQATKLGWEIRCDISRQDHALKQLTSPHSDNEMKEMKEMKEIEEKTLSLKEKLAAVRHQMHQPESIELEKLIQQQVETIKRLNQELFGRTYEGSPSFYRTV